MQPMQLAEIGTILNVIVAILALLGALGTVIGYVNRAKKVETGRLNEETINALRSRIDSQQLDIIALREKQEELKTENIKLRQIIETIKAALSKRGTKITIDGELVVVEEASGAVSSLPHKRTTVHKTVTEEIQPNGA